MDEESRFPEQGELEPRPPTMEDVLALCTRLNGLGAKYLIVGGFAIIQAGHPRMTGDLDLLIEDSLENEALVFKALEILHDQAVKEFDPGDVAKYTVCRLADEIIVDIMAAACGIRFADTLGHIDWVDLDGVNIPFASPHLLWLMKFKTHREKDIPDLVFLREWFARKGIQPPSA